MNVKEEILQRTNRGLDIFYFYMPINFVPKRNFRNPLYEDKRASCNIYLDAKSDCYHMKDFGNDLYSCDCFWFAATMQGLDAHTEFMQVLETIIRDLQLSISLPGKARSAAPVRKREFDLSNRQERGMYKLLGGVDGGLFVEKGESS